MEKHKEELLKKSEMKTKQFEALLFIILQKVRIIPTDILHPYRKKAYEAMKNIDPDDTLFIACALAFPQSILWSDDKKLKQQTLVHIINTQEMNRLFLREKIPDNT